MMSPSESVQKIYEAFGRGDIPAILDRLADDVEWEYGAVSTDVPWLQAGRGKAAAGRFFEALGGIDFHAFQVKAVVPSGALVIALVDLDASVRQTGRRLSEEDEVHIWHFDASGKVRRFRHRADTHQHWLAFHGK
jgi:ketosteroid isomerase-like protein